MLDMMFKLKTNRDDYAVVRFCSEDNAGKYLMFEHDGIIYYRKSKSKLMCFNGNDWIYLGIYMELYLNESKKELFKIDKIKIIDELGLDKVVQRITELIMSLNAFIINPDIKILTIVEEEDET